MKTLDEVIEILSLKQYMKPEAHPMTADEIQDALWYMRNYRDVLQTLNKLKLAFDIVDFYIKKDLNHEDAR